MIPSRLFSARPQAMLEGVGFWMLAARVVPGPSCLLLLRASPRLLSVSCADCTKHQEPPRKQPLSEKKLVRLLETLKGFASSFLIGSHRVLF